MDRLIFGARMARMADGGGAAAAALADPPAGDAQAASATTTTAPPDAAAAAAAAFATTTTAPPPADKPWLETVKLDDAVKSLLVNNGFHTARDDKGDARPATIEETLAKAAQAYDSAQRKLGAKPEDLLAAPKADQPLAEWLKANGKRLGVPEKAEAYGLEKPKLPEDMPWDAGFEKEALERFHAAGMPKALAQEAVNLFAGKMVAMHEAAKGESTAARAEMMTALRADWGGQAEARIGQAARAFQHFAQSAGIDAESQAAMVAAMAGAAGKGGDARVLKLFAKIHEAMGEDRIVGGDPAGGGLQTTPAEARARLDAIKARDGDWAKAAAARDGKRQQELSAEIARLSLIVAPPKGQ